MNIYESYWDYLPAEICEIILREREKKYRKEHEKRFNSVLMTIINFVQVYDDNQNTHWLRSLPNRWARSRKKIQEPRWLNTASDYNTFDFYKEVLNNGKFIGGVRMPNSCVSVDSCFISSFSKRRSYNFKTAKKKRRKGHEK